jgi:hypothetical protein
MVPGRTRHTRFPGVATDRIAHRRRADEEHGTGNTTKRSQTPFHARMTSCLDGPIYPLKAVAQVRVLSGLLLVTLSWQGGVSATLALHELVVNLVVNKSEAMRMVTNSGEQIIHHRQTSRSVPSGREVRLGVKGSQVQILSARPIEIDPLGLVTPLLAQPVADNCPFRPRWHGPHSAPTRPKARCQPPPAQPYLGADTERSPRGPGGRRPAATRTTGPHSRC